jgi:putative membrane protein
MRSEEDTLKVISRFALGLMLTGALALPTWAQSSGAGAGSSSGQSSSQQSSGMDAGAGAGQSGSMSSGQAAGKTLSRTDRAFIEKAAAGGMMEVQLGKLAQEKAADQQVKDFGKRMEDDHSKANEQLKSVAQDKGVDLPTSLPAKEQAKVDKLSKLSGADFDKQYMTEMVADHKKDVAEFEKASKTAKDEAVKNFASSTAPTLQEHLKLAQEVHGKVRGTQSASKKTGGKKE